ncbi:hypothetical protein ACJIZ3_001257 [Penstemon smallii]|uniref:Uncharacterized protein n=1 Tax=Penstemon smallii TaxID=265156 RepID=A0ABD3U329_9LAMI
MDMFMTEDNPVRRHSEKVTEHLPFCLDALVTSNDINSSLFLGSIFEIVELNSHFPENISSSCIYLNNGGMWSLSGMGDRRVPSKYSMSIVPAVTELITAQFFLPTICRYNEKMETVGSETEAYAIADTMAVSNS